MMRRENPWSLLPVVSMVTASVISLLLMVVLMVSGDWRIEFTWGAILLPTITAVAALAALSVFEHTLQRARRLIASAAALAVVAVGVLVLSTLFSRGADDPVGEGSVWWYAALAAGHAALAVLLARLIPEQATAVQPPADDAEWEQQAAGILRQRTGMPEATIQAHLARAREEAARSGLPLGEQFGRPTSFASGFPKDRQAEERRRLWLYTAVAPLTLVIALGDVVSEGWDWSRISWPFVAVFLLAAGSAAVGWRRSSRRGQDLGD